MEDDWDAAYEALEIACAAVGHGEHGPDPRHDALVADMV